MNNIATIGMIAAVIVVSLITVFFILARLYQRASKEVSFVRTGLGGQKVIMNGGALVLPVLQEIIPVNMNTLRLEVRRSNEQALITHDRMRVDVTAEFYVRVKPTEDSIANAAQTLGVKTMNPEALKELVEGKFVDALRAVAAEMAMEQLHEKRVDFVQKVQQVTAEDLLKNGLELESVSLTGLDQTSFEYFNPQNAFDAEGLTRLTETIESRRKTRNDIEQETEVQIKTKNLEAERKRLELQREEEYARLEQQREIETRRAAQSSEIAREQAMKEREAQEARIAAEREVESARIAAERMVEEERIEKERLLKQKDVERNRAVETAEVERRQSVRLAEQDSEIAVAEKSKAESEAQAAASRARAAAVKEQEAVETVRQTERAERLKAVELVEARQRAERDAISITVAAEAEKQAADDRAASIRIEAEAEAERARIAADGDAQAEKLRAEAAAIRYQVEAEGKRSLNEADNTLSAEQIAMQVRMALIENLPGIIRESVRPMEQIEGIKIIQVDGLNGGHGYAGGGDMGGEGAGGSLADQVVNSALRYRAQGPLVDSLLKEIGLKPGDLNGMTGALQSVEEGAATDAKSA